jgi:hypothetical protein
MREDCTINKTYSLTEPQKFIWLANNLSDELNASVTFDVLFNGELNLSAACMAVNYLFIYNQALRTEITAADGVPRQLFKEYDPGKKYFVVKSFSSLNLYKTWVKEYALAKMY